MFDYICFVHLAEMRLKPNSVNDRGYEGLTI